MADETKPKRKKFKTPKRIALVTWEDAYFSGAPQTEAELLAEEEKKVLYTVGFFIKETDKYITLTMEFDDSDKTHRDICRILKANIKEVQFIG